MTFLLDTNICSAHLRRPASLAHRFFQHSGRLFIPTVVVAELYAGAYSSSNFHSLAARIESMLRDLTILDFGRTEAENYGRLMGALSQQGLVVSTPDLMIAASAVSHNLVLVTHNTADFQMIPELRLEDWLLP